jgi:hypothetical protein
MADLKISQLTAISVLTPATDVLPVVDSGGVTKKITTNQILGSGGTATLASATITGALTAARLIVTGGTIPTNGLWLATTNTLEFAANSLAQYRIAPLGVFSWFDGQGGTRMTLDSTGLAIGTTAAQKLTVLTNIGISAITAAAADDRLIFTENMASANLGSQIVWKTASSGNAYASIGITNGAAGNSGTLIFSTSSSIFGSNNVERMRIDNAGNLILQSSATPATLGTNGMLTVNATSNTNLRFSYRGSDGTTRVANITLA